MACLCQVRVTPQSPVRSAGQSHCGHHCSFRETSLSHEVNVVHLNSTEGEGVSLVCNLGGTVKLFKSYRL